MTALFVVAYIIVAYVVIGTALATVGLRKVDHRLRDAAVVGLAWPFVLAVALLALIDEEAKG